MHDDSRNFAKTLGTYIDKVYSSSDLWHVPSNETGDLKLIGIGARLIVAVHIFPENDIDIGHAADGPLLIWKDRARPLKEEVASIPREAAWHLRRLGVDIAEDLIVPVLWIPASGEKKSPSLSLCLEAEPSAFMDWLWPNIPADPRDETEHLVYLRSVMARGRPHNIRMASWQRLEHLRGTEPRLCSPAMITASLSALAAINQMHPQKMEIPADATDEISIFARGFEMFLELNSGGGKSTAAQASAANLARVLNGLKDLTVPEAEPPASPDSLLPDFDAESEHLFDAMIGA